MKAILTCRTAALGAHVDRCDECGYEAISYNSCRNRHCPKCQTFAKEQWIENQKQSLLNTQYFHLVFTVPSELYPLFYQNQRALYNLLFKASSETLLELCSDPKYLGAKPGVTAVLHTWGQNLSYHPHLHCVVTGGGLTPDQQWKHSRHKFFLPVKVLSRMFRGKFLYYLRREALAFFTSVAHLNDPNTYAALLDSLYKKEWVVYCKKPFGVSDQHGRTLTRNKNATREGGRSNIIPRIYLWRSLRSRAITVLWWQLAAREKIINGCRGVVRQCMKQESQVLGRIQAIFLGGLNDGKDNGTGSGAGGGVGEKEILAIDDKWFD